MYTIEMEEGTPQSNANILEDAVHTKNALLLDPTKNLPTHQIVKDYQNNTIAFLFLIFTSKKTNENIMNNDYKRPKIINKFYSHC